MDEATIKHLAALARIELTEEELVSYQTEMSAILQYVSAVSSIVGDDVVAEPEVGARYNVFRRDEVTNESEQFTADMLAAMPQTNGRYLTVKKILENKE